MREMRARVLRCRGYGPALHPLRIIDRSARYGHAPHGCVLCRLGFDSALSACPGAAEALVVLIELLVELLVQVFVFLFELCAELGRWIAKKTSLPLPVGIVIGGSIIGLVIGLAVFVQSCEAEARSAPARDVTVERLIDGLRDLESRRRSPDA